MLCYLKLCNVMTHIRCHVRHRKTVRIVEKERHKDIVEENRHKLDVVKERKIEK